MNDFRLQTEGKQLDGKHIMSFLYISRSIDEELIYADLFQIKL